MIKISVVVPVYNGEKYLQECLDSILNQTLEEIEIICIDDASTDQTSSILQQYKSQQSRIKIITNPINSGPGVSRNKGLDKATGKYVIFLDADDIFEKDMLNQVFQRMEHDSADICTFGEDENITLFSFDHGYLCGISNPNLNKIIAKRPTDYWLLKKKFGEKVIYIPAWSDDFYSKEGRYYVPGKNHSALITASGAARFYKVDGHIPFRYLDMVVVLLKKTNGIHYHFGELPDKAKEELREKMESENIAQEHFVHIPWSDDLPEELLKRHVDVFIEPFPVVSYKLTLEVLSAGVPVIAQQGLTRMSITDFLPKDAFIWKNAEEFLSILSNVTREEWKEQSENALKYFKEYHSVEQIKNYLRENVGLPEPKKYVYPDSDLLDITSSFQLFENYFQISIMSRDKKEDKKTPKKDGSFCEKLEELYFQQKKDAAITKKMILGAIEKTLRRNTIEHLDYHITDHCNLNCQGCSVFAPVAEKRFADLDSFEKDMRDLHTLIGDAIQQIHLLGGEPLLHPKAEQFAQICRSVFRGG